MRKMWIEKIISQKKTTCGITTQMKCCDKKDEYFVEVHCMESFCEGEELLIDEEKEDNSITINDWSYFKDIYCDDECMDCVYSVYGCPLEKL
jgi:hypothetical protein